MPNYAVFLICNLNFFNILQCFSCCLKTVFTVVQVGKKTGRSKLYDSKTTATNGKAAPTADGESSGTSDSGSSSSDSDSSSEESEPEVPVTRGSGE